MLYYDKNKKHLLMFYKNRKRNYWDEYWQNKLIKEPREIYKFNPKSMVCKITPQFLNPNNGFILEGGCGIGDNIYNLNIMNYDVIGIDNAKSTIKKVKEINKMIRIEYADVRQIPFSDNYFAGYWSLGVIEHFYHGYNDILREMKRVIKPKGILFISFPYMSPFREFKSKINFYKVVNLEQYKLDKPINSFYQYILNKNTVIKDIEANGFRLIYTKPTSGIKGFKDEVFFLTFFFKNFFQLLFNNETSKILRIIKTIIEKVLNSFTGHSILLIFQKLN